jgi:DNA-binding NarL/FixJ family response regulator
MARAEQAAVTQVGLCLCRATDLRTNHGLAADQRCRHCRGMSRCRSREGGRREAKSQGCDVVEYTFSDSDELAATVLLAQTRGNGDIDNELPCYGELLRQGLFPWRFSIERLRDLSPREHEVFLLLGLGLSNRSISHVLGVTERTVKAHVGRVLGKLTLESRLQAGLAAFALASAGGDVLRDHLVDDP